MGLLILHAPDEGYRILKVLAARAAGLEGRTGKSRS